MKYGIVILLLLGSSVLGINILRGQNLLLLSDFENPEDTSWISRNSGIVSGTGSYSGQGALQVKGPGESHKFIEVPGGVKEITFKAFLKVSGVTFKSTQKVATNQNYISGDTVLVFPKTYQAVSISIDGYYQGSSKKVALLPNGEEIYFTRNSPWALVEREIKIPTGIVQIRISCRNSIEGSVALFDEIKIGKRQAGLVKQETAWANSVRANQAKANLIVKNGTFENGAENWDPYWGFNLSDISHSGKYSCLIQNADSGKWKGSGCIKPFQIPTGTTWLKVTAWIKADQVKGGPNAWETGAMVISLMDNKDNEVPGGDALARTVGTHDWRKFEALFPVSDRVTQFKILLHLAASTGKIYFDDIYAQALNDEQYYLENIELKNPGFESQLSSWPGYAGDATTEEAHSGEYALRVGGKEVAWQIRNQTITLKRDKKEVTIGAWIKAVQVSETPNSWEGGRIFVELKDVNGLVILTESVARVIGTTDWEKKSIRISIPEDAVSMTVSCGRANVSGNVYFDDISIEY